MSTAPLAALLLIIVGFGGAVGALMFARNGINRMMAGNNPRAQAGNHDEMVGIIKGLGVLGAAGVLGTLLATTLKW